MQSAVAVEPSYEPGAVRPYTSLKLFPGQTDIYLAGWYRAVCRCEFCLLLLAVPETTNMSHPALDHKPHTEQAHYLCPRRSTRGSEAPRPCLGQTSCSYNGLRFEEFLVRVASQGTHPRQLLANGVPGGQDNPNRIGEMSNPDASFHLQALGWIMEGGGVEAYANADTSRIAAVGQSCGGIQAYSVVGDECVTALGIFNSEIIDASDPLLSTITKPVFYFFGGPTDIAYKNMRMNSIHPPTYSQHECQRTTDKEEAQQTDSGRNSGPQLVAQFGDHRMRQRQAALWRCLIPLAVCLAVMTNIDCSTSCHSYRQAP